MSRVLPLWFICLAVYSLLACPSKALEPQPKIYFEDVTERSGLKIERVTSAEKRHLIETMGGGVAFLDYDRDGWLDVYLTNAPTVQLFKSGKSDRLPANRLYRNNRDGTFTDASEGAGVAFRGWSFGVSVADYNNDGFPDIYLTNFGPNALYRNNGDGTFTDVTGRAGVGDARWSSSSGWADYDGDGNLDLFVANYVEYDLDRLPEFGRGRYCLYKSLEVLCGPRGMKGAGDALYRNNGDGTFTETSNKAGVSDESGRYGLGVAWGDFDDDGDQDLFVANDTQANYLYLNRGDGSFREAGPLSGAALDSNGKARAGMGVAVGDYDHDGRLDIGVTNFSEEAYALFHNQGAGNFTDKAFAAGIGKASLAYLGWGMFFGDFDNDGWSDLFAANGHVYTQVDRLGSDASYRQRCMVFRNLGGGNFADVSAEAGAGVNTPRAHRGAALGDYDNDGDLDVLLMDLDGGPTLLENRSQPRGAYLRVKSPVGSRITVEAAGVKQVDETRASGSYQSAPEQFAHFGLGAASTVEKVIVRFPNGKSRTLTDIKVNQSIMLD
jgi:enediyne biosynthesis protein E4